MIEQTKSQSIDWSLAQIWNEVAFKSDRPLQARDYIYASEVGGAFVDRYLKMKAEPYTNPPNNRSQRKFLAGNLIELIVKQILIAAGIYKYDEIKVDANPYKDCLSVHGRYDFRAGGWIDGELARIKVAALNLPDYLVTISDKIICAIENKQLEERILELKSISSFGMDKVEKSRAAIPQHTMQSYHYQKNAGIIANICYLCKDDMRMAQFGIDEVQTETLYRADIEAMTHYYTKNEKPAPAPLARFDPLIGKFAKNLQVEYSPYLSLIYGFATPDDYRLSVNYVDKWNRCLARYVLAETGQKTPSGKPVSITAKNKEVRASIEHAGYDMDDLIRIKIDLGATEDDDSEE